MTDIKECRALVCQFIDDLGLDSFEQRSDKNSWWLERGSAFVSILIFENQEDSDASMIFATANIMKVPLHKALPFYRKLLEINSSLCGRCAFSVTDENLVHVTTGRPIRDLDESELEYLVHTVAWAADKYDDLLLDEFGRENALPD